MIQTEEIIPNPITPQLEKDLDSMSFLSSLKGLSFDDAVSKIAHTLINFGFKLCIAILVFYIGRFVINKIYKVVYKTMTSRKVDASLTTFVLSLIRITLYFILIITVIGILGIETSSFIAIFASAGVALGMALSGTLQNFAGGVLILLLKPYKVGDYIEAQGYAGTVKSIQLFNTVINTIDNKAIILPNGGLSTSSINNYSLEAYRRVDWNIGLAYGTDLEKAKEVMLSMLNEDERIIKENCDESAQTSETKEGAEEGKTSEGCIEAEVTQGTAEEPKKTKRGVIRRMFRRHRKEIQKAVTASALDIPIGMPTKRALPFVALKEMADSAIIFTVRAWTKSEDYWPVYFHMTERFYTELPQHGFSFPFPQMDVHMDSNV